MTAQGDLGVDVGADGRTLTVRDAAGRAMATLTLSTPGRPAEGWRPDGDDILLARDGDLETRARLFFDLDAWSLFLTVDNRGAEPRELPELGLGVEIGDGYAGWSWGTDVDGFLVVAAATAAEPVVVLRVRQGFWRASGTGAVFGRPVRPGVGAFHLARPGAALGADRRHQVVVQASRVPSLDAVTALLPEWLPPTVGPEGAEFEFRLLDAAVVAGRHTEVQTTERGTTVTLTGAGHGAVGLHDVRGVRTVRLSCAPTLLRFLPSLVEALKSRRPSVRSTATGVVVAEALMRGAVADPMTVIDWLEREDWLGRGEAAGVAIAGILAAQTDDRALLEDAWRCLASVPVTPGYGLVTMRLWLTTLGLTSGGPAEARALLARPATDDLSRLELALLSEPQADAVRPGLAGLVNALGGRLPGRPVGLPAGRAGLMVSLLKLCPESWTRSSEAFETAAKAQGLLLADYADGLLSEDDGLAWLLLGELGI